MLRSKAPASVALIVACAVLFAAPASSQQPAQKAGFRPCPEMKERYVNGIRVREVSCPKAKQVIIRYTEEIIDNLQHDWSLTIMGFHCDLTRKDYYGDSHRCAKGDRIIRFRRGTH